jgi:lactoylglutathione lyase
MDELSLRLEVFPSGMDRFLDFYSRVLRFRVLRDERTADPPYAYVQRGSVSIGASRRSAPPNAGQRRPPVGVEVVLEVDDLDAEYRAVTDAGWPIDEPITHRPWGLDDFRLLDPDGYYLRFTSRAAR